MAFNHSPNAFHQAPSCRIERNLLVRTNDSIHHSFDHWDHSYCTWSPYWHKFGPPRSYESPVGGSWRDFDCPSVKCKGESTTADQQGIISQSVLEAFIPPRHQFSSTKIVTPECQPKQDDDGSNIIWELRSNDIGK